MFFLAPLLAGLCGLGSAAATGLGSALGLTATAAPAALGTAAAAAPTLAAGAGTGAAGAGPGIAPTLAGSTLAATPGALEAGMATGVSAAANPAAALSGAAMAPTASNVALAGTTAAGEVAPAATSVASAAGKTGLGALLTPKNLMLMGGAASMLMPRNSGKEDEGDSNYKDYKNWDNKGSAPPYGFDAGKGEWDWGFKKFAAGGAVRAAGNDQIGAAAVAAIQGKSPDPQAAVKAFIAAFGLDAFERLVAQVRAERGHQRADQS